MSSVCSPIESPVEGSATFGAAGQKSRGRNFMNCLNLSVAAFAVAASMKIRLARSLNSNAGLDKDSTPPAIPTSARSATIES